MRAKRILVVGGACVLGLAVVHLSSLTTEPNASAPSPATAATPAAIAPPVAASPRTEVRFATPLPAAQSTPQASRAAPARERAVLERIEQDLGERLRAERVDPSWAPETERAIANAFAGPKFAGLQLDAVSCGRTMCKLVVSASEQVADVEGTLEELTTKQPLRAGGFLRFTGPRTATLFVTRAGHKLPPAPKS